MEDQGFFGGELPPDYSDYLTGIESKENEKKEFDQAEYDRMFQKYADRFKIYEKDFKTYKFRPHALGNIMGGIPKGLTEKQAETYAAYTDRRNGIGKPLTLNQDADWHDLRRKKDAKPMLNPGAKTYLKKLFKEITFSRTEEIKSKYLDKGIICEEASIIALSEFHGVEYKKNTIRYENDYFTGEPDIVEPKEVIDVKSSWDYTTFPMFDEELENKDYYWQILAYMDLIDVKKGRVCYVLNDTPDQMIYEEKKRVSWKLGLLTKDFVFDLPPDLDFEIERNMTYEDVPQEARIKEFPIVKNDDDLKMIKAMIDLARIFMQELSDGLSKQFTNHLKV